MIMLFCNQGTTVSYSIVISLDTLVFKMVVHSITDISIPCHIHNPLRATYKFISITDCEHEEFSRNRQDTALIALLLAVRHHSSAKGVNRVLTFGSRYVAGQSANTRQRVAYGSANKTYDRIMTFADTLDAGRCFCVILENNYESRDFFNESILSQEGVGEVFLLEEPKSATFTLGSTGSVPIMSGCHRVIPLNIPYNQVIPSVPIGTHPVGHTSYFSTHSVVDLALTVATIQTSCCIGSFCDRQSISTNRNEQCGCFYQDRKPAKIVDLDVILTVPEQFDPKAYTTITNFCSWQTSQLFLTPDTWSVIKKDVKRVVEYVNSNGGLTYIGWLRTGAVRDASDAGSAENLASTTMHPHLSYLYPSNVNLPDTKEFSVLRLSLSTNATHQMPNLLPVQDTNTI
jgi:hypothetical protein